MRIFIILTILFLSYSVPTHALTPEGNCKSYSELSFSDALKYYEELLSQSRKLDLKVGNYLAAGTPQANHDFSSAASELGDTIGKSYALCTCNKSFSQSKNCQAFVEHIKKSRLVK